MGWKSKLSVAALVFVITLQFLPNGAKHNPPVRRERSFERHLQLTPEVSDLLRRACLDCHSNETRWPWYSQIAPVSWLIARDVDRGRQVWNLSEWSLRAGRRPEIGASTLLAACAAAKSGRMPRFPYGIFHPEARLSAADIQVLCGWTAAEAQRLIRMKKQRALSAELRLDGF